VCKSLDNLKKDKTSLKFITNKLLTWGQLHRSFDSADAGIGNIVCPFHEVEGFGSNTSKSAHFYEQDDSTLILHCFTSRRTYTPYDYIVLVLEEDVVTALKRLCDIDQVLKIYDDLMKGNLQIGGDVLEAQRQYIDNTYTQSGQNCSMYIEMLYTKGLV